jgi:HlyD family secretion protein
VNSGLASVNTRRQALASAALAVQKAQNDLALLRAGTDPEQIAAQKAVVRQAEASVATAQAQMNKRVLHSPLDGVVTLQDAKVGEIISAGKEVSAVIANTGFEIEANIPEVDVAKLAVGNPVRITFDAFPQIPFTGTVSHIDPGETIVDGVVNFKVKVTLAQSPDLSRVRNGLTANLSIETRRREQVLILPQYAVLDTDHGPIVRKLVNGYATETPVTLGVRGEDGTVEILSGLSEHDLVENIGIRSAE